MLKTGDKMKGPANARVFSFSRLIMLRRDRQWPPVLTQPHTAETVGITEHTNGRSWPLVIEQWDFIPTTVGFQRRSAVWDLELPLQLADLKTYQFKNTFKVSTYWEKNGKK
jgi:hypothetical protein